MTSVDHCTLAKQNTRFWSPEQNLNLILNLIKKTYCCLRNKNTQIPAWKQTRKELTQSPNKKQ